MYKLYGIFLDHFIHNLKYLIRKRNFFFFSFFKFILILDRKLRLKIFKVRNFFDYITVREIFVLECYKFENLINYDEILNYYNQIFKKKKIPLIIDCGANIGASSFYFYNKFNNSKIISLEPDDSNFKYLNKNINYKNIDKIEKAISSDSKNFEIIRNTEDPRAYSVSSNQEGSIESTTVNNILNIYSENEYEPFIIKIDIEGSEQELFSQNIEWLDKFKIILIEPHDWMYPKKNTFHNFIKNISIYKRDFIILNENILSIRND